MLLKKAIITGIASLSTVSVVGVSAFNYVKNVKTDEKENCAISLETNSVIYTNLAQALEENADKTEEDFDVKVSNALPQSQEHTESDNSEKNTSESTSKTNSLNNINDNTSIHNPEVNVAEADNGIPNTNDTSGNIPSKTTTENKASSSASTNNDSKNSSQGNTPAIAAAAPPANTDSSSASTETSNMASNSASTNTSSKNTNKENVPAISEAAAPANSDSSNASADTGSTNNNNYRTVSYYTNDESTLLRVEYYDDNSKLVEYSAVTNYDKDTNSYTETVYQYDYENNAEVTMRTDTYVDGEIVSSEIP